MAIKGMMKRNNKLRSNIHLFIYHSTIILSTFYMPHLVLGIEDTTIYQIDKFLLSGSLYSRKERQTTHQQIDKMSGCDKHYEKK